jgi:hypothetical protein
MKNSSCNFPALLLALLALLILLAYFRAQCPRTMQGVTQAGAKEKQPVLHGYQEGPQLISDILSARPTPLP